MTKTYSFRSTLSEIMLSKGFNIMKLSEITAYKYNTVRDWYNGKSEPDASEIMVIAKALKVPPSDLFDEVVKVSKKLTLSPDVLRAAEQLQELETLEPGTAQIYEDHISKWVSIAKKRSDGDNKGPHDKRKLGHDNEGETPINPFSS